MKKGKRLLSVCLVVVMVFAVMLSAGCSAKNNSTTDQTTTAANTTEKATTAATTAKQLDEVTLKWVTALPSVETDRDLVYEALNKIVKEKINATVKFDIIDFGQWQTRIPVLLASNEDMDIVWHNWQFSFAGNVAKGLYQPMDELLKENGQTILRDIPAALLDNQRIGGKIYAIPCYQISTAGNVYTIKQDCVDKTGFDIAQIKGLYDFEPFLKAIKEKMPDLYPIQAQKGGLWNCYRMEKGWEIIISGDGVPLAVDYADNTKKVFNMFALPEFKEYCENIHRWYKEGYIQKDIASVQSVEAEENAGKYGVIIGGTVKYPGAAAADYTANKGYQCTEVITSKSFWQYTAGQATMLSIPTQSKNPERAMMLLDLLNDNVEAANTLAYGIKDKHYTLNEKNQVARIRDVGYNFDWQWSMLNTFKLYVDATRPANESELVQKTHAEAVPSQLAGYVPNADEYTTELAQCQTAWQEMGIGLQTGVMDPAVYLPRFLEALKSAGVDKLVETVQKQIDSQLKQ